MGGGEGIYMYNITPRGAAPRSPLPSCTPCTPCTPCMQGFSCPLLPPWQHPPFPAVPPEAAAALSQKPPGKSQDCFRSFVRSERREGWAGPRVRQGWRRSVSGTSLFALKPAEIFPLCCVGNSIALASRVFFPELPAFGKCFAK